MDSPGTSPQAQVFWVLVLSILLYNQIISERRQKGWILPVCDFKVGQGYSAACEGQNYFCRWIYLLVI
ncbi:hypothetical protein GDO81_013671 [Engystomops pustulosus]|uniref:Uncharacterized protein n=1 Tax=Engystomops pustulosus TaxID=76066 RepID=A0AAV7B4K8_ENGPU|nr:hypothetical protein GDO81_013671 [Engystomops pustulosus]